jgi:hypothetical protein
MSPTQPPAATLPLDLRGAFELYLKLGVEADKLPLGGPLAATNLEALQDALERPVPYILRECLALHDGVGDGLASGSAELPVANAAALPQIAYLFATSAESDLSEYENHHDLGDEDLRHHLPLETLFPIGTRADGDTLFLDLKERTAQDTIPVYRLVHDSVLTCKPVARSLGELIAREISSAAGEHPARLDVVIATRSEANARGAAPVVEVHLVEFDIDSAPLPEHRRRQGLRRGRLRRLERFMASVRGSPWVVFSQLGRQHHRQQLGPWTATGIVDDHQEEACGSAL